MRKSDAVEKGDARRRACVFGSAKPFVVPPPGFWRQDARKGADTSTLVPRFACVSPFFAQLIAFLSGRKSPERLRLVERPSVPARGRGAGDPTDEDAQEGQDDADSDAHVPADVHPDGELAHVHETPEENARQPQQG